jgi:hypothetical protein
MLQAAPFEGDEQMRRDLLKSTDTALTAVSQEAAKNSFGNLSNFSTSVLRAGTLYEKGATPITQNMKQYQTYVQGLKDDVEKGGLDAEDYQINLGLSTKDYKGLSTNEQGEVENYFTGVTAWQNPDLLGMIDKAIKNISVDGETTVTNILGVGPNGMYDVETTQGIKQIHPDKIKAALNGVFNDKKVVGYYDRKAEGRVAFMDDATVQKNLMERVSGLKKQAAEETDEGRIDGLRQQIGGLEDALSGKSEDMRNTLRSTMLQDMLGTYRDAAVAGKQKLETVYKQKTTYNPVYMKALESEMSGAAAGTQAGVVFTEQGVSYARPGGGNAHEYSKAIMQKTDEFDALRKQLAEAEEKGAPESELASLSTQLYDMRRSITADNYMFKSMFGESYSEVINSPEYKELQSKLRGNIFHTHEGGAGFFTAAKMGLSDLANTLTGGLLGTDQEGMNMFDIDRQWNEYGDTQQAMRDIFEERGLKDDPRGETGTMSIPYVPLSGMGVKTSAATAIERDLADKFGMGFEPTMRVIDPNTGEIATAEEVLGRGDYSYYPSQVKEVEYDGVLFSRAAPMSLMPEHMLVQWKGKKGSPSDGQTGTLMVPLGPSTGVSIPSLDNYYNQPSVRLIGELEGYKMMAAPGTKTIDFDWAGQSQTEGPLQGSLAFDVNNGWIDVYDFDGNQIGERMSMYEPVFHKTINDNQISLR